MIEKVKELLTPDTTERISYEGRGFLVIIMNIILVIVIVFNIIIFIILIYGNNTNATNDTIIQGPPGSSQGIKEETEQSAGFSNKIACILRIFVCVIHVLFALILLFWFNNFYCTWTFVVIVILLIQPKFRIEAALIYFLFILVVVKFKLVIPYEYRHNRPTELSVHL